MRRKKANDVAPIVDSASLVRTTLIRAKPVIARGHQFDSEVYLTSARNGYDASNSEAPFAASCVNWSKYIFDRST